MIIILQFFMTINFKDIVRDEYSFSSVYLGCACIMCRVYSTVEYSEVQCNAVYSLNMSKLV